MKISESKYGECIYFASNALARKVEKVAADIWAKVDLSPSHAYLLMLVIEKPGIQPSLIAENLQLTPSTITRLLEKLENKKLLIRTMDGRVTNVYPSPKAKEMVPRLLACVKEFSQQSMALFGKEETAKLIDSISKVADKLEL